MMGLYRIILVISFFVVWSTSYALEDGDKAFGNCELKGKKNNQDVIDCLNIEDLDGQTITIPENASRLGKNEIALCGLEGEKFPAAITYIMDNSSSMAPQSGVGGQNTVLYTMGYEFNELEEARSRIPESSFNIFLSGDPETQRAEAIKDAIRTQKILQDSSLVGFYEFTDELRRQFDLSLAVDLDENTINNFILAEATGGTKYLPPLIKTMEQYRSGVADKHLNRAIIFVTDGTPQDREDVLDSLEAWTDVPPIYFIYLGIYKREDVEALFPGESVSAIDALMERINGPDNFLDSIATLTNGAYFRIEGNELSHLVDSLVTEVSNKIIPADVQLENKANNVVVNSAGAIHQPGNDPIIEFESELALVTGENEITISAEFGGELKKATFSIIVEEDEDEWDGNDLFDLECFETDLIFTNDQNESIALYNPETGRINFQLTTGQFPENSSKVELTTLIHSDHENPTLQKTDNAIDSVVLRGLEENTIDITASENNSSLEFALYDSLFANWTHPADPRNKASAKILVYKPAIIAFGEDEISANDFTIELEEGYPFDEERTITFHWIEDNETLATRDIQVDQTSVSATFDLSNEIANNSDNQNRKLVVTYTDFAGNETSDTSVVKGFNINQLKIMDEKDKTLTRIIFDQSQIILELSTNVIDDETTSVSISHHSGNEVFEVELNKFGSDGDNTLYRLEVDNDNGMLDFGDEQLKLEAWDSLFVVWNPDQHKDILEEESVLVYDLSSINFEQDTTTSYDVDLMIRERHPQDDVEITLFWKTLDLGKPSIKIDGSNGDFALSNLDLKDYFNIDGLEGCHELIGEYRDYLHNRYEDSVTICFNVPAQLRLLDDKGDVVQRVLFESKTYTVELRTSTEKDSVTEVTFSTLNESVAGGLTLTKVEETTSYSIYQGTLESVNGDLQLESSTLRPEQYDSLVIDWNASVTPYESAQSQTLVYDVPRIEFLKDTSRFNDVTLNIQEFYPFESLDVTLSWGDIVYDDAQIKISDKNGFDWTNDNLELTTIFDLAKMEDCQELYADYIDYVGETHRDTTHICFIEIADSADINIEINHKIVDYTKDIEFNDINDREIDVVIWDGSGDGFKILDPNTNNIEVIGDYTPIEQSLVYTTVLEVTQDQLETWDYSVTMSTHYFDHIGQYLRKHDSQVDLNENVVPTADGKIYLSTVWKPKEVGGNLYLMEDYNGRKVASGVVLLKLSVQVLMTLKEESHTFEKGTKVRHGETSVRSVGYFRKQ